MCVLLRCLVIQWPSTEIYTRIHPGPSLAPVAAHRVPASRPAEPACVLWAEPVCFFGGFLCEERSGSTATVPPVALYCASPPPAASGLGAQCGRDSLSPIPGHRIIPIETRRSAPNPLFPTTVTAGLACSFRGSGLRLALAAPRAAPTESAASGGGRGAGRGRGAGGVLAIPRPIRSRHGPGHVPQDLMQVLGRSSIMARNHECW
jgi:hypothetical protein